MDRRDVLAGLAISPALAQEAKPTTPVKRIDVKGAVALVTGSNRGVGRGFVEVLLARGAKRVYATGRNPKNLDEIVALDPKRVVALELDVTNDAHRKAAAAKATDLTMLINNAAYPGSETAEERRFLSATTLDDIKRSMDTNCWSPAELARLFIPIILKNSKAGAVLNILSGGALFCLPEFTSYSTSKAAEMMMTAGLRAETDRMPISIISVFTGGVQTRALPIGAKINTTPVDHANEVFDLIQKGLTSIFPSTGPVNMRDRICQDPDGFERRTIDRFHTNPVKIAPYE